MSDPQDRPPGRPPGQPPGRGLPPQGPAGAPRPQPGARPLPPHLDPRAPRRPHGSRRTTPLPSQEPSRGRMARVLSFLAVLTSFSVLAVAVGGYVLVNKYDGQIQRIDGVFPAGGERPEETPRDARNILIVGSDSRGDLAAGEGTQGRGDTFVTGQRSDTMILAHLYGDSDKAQLVSLPRDSWVTIPGFTDPATGDFVEQHEAKLNSAFERGGPSLLIRTVEELAGLRVDNYVQIDFEGFLSMVNTLGGVEVCLSEPAKEKDSGIDLPAGRQTIKGSQALAFVRQRQGLPRGDLDRIARQQQFIAAIVRKTLSTGTLLSPFRLNDTLNVATEALQVDEDTTIDDLRDLATRFRTFDAGGVVFTTLPVADPDSRQGRQRVVLLDQAGTDELFTQLRDDVPPDEVAARRPAAEPLLVAPEAVQLRVLNGAGVSGLGRRAYDELAAVGFQLVDAPANRGSEAVQTTVYHGPDKADSARTVAAAMPGSRTELDPALTSTLEVVVGSSYDGATAVSVAPTEQAPTPGDEVTPTPAPGVRTAAEDPCAA